MKNIHVLPTDKPSNLAIQLDCKPNYNLQLSKIADDWTKNWEKQNIYITNSEEIKEGDWFLNDMNILFKADKNYIKNPAKEVYIGHKKIILTTDQDLIKQGIQAIEDEFLNWFVKNPSCEKVEVAELWKQGYPSVHDSYQITIPKEEPKQETLEEVAERLFPNKMEEYDIFLMGAKWQQERMYSEEEVKQAYIDGSNNPIEEDDCYGTEFFKYMDEWFEQFKKK